MWRVLCAAALALTVALGSPQAALADDAAAKTPAPTVVKSVEGSDTAEAASGGSVSYTVEVALPADLRDHGAYPLAVIDSADAGVAVGDVAVSYAGEDVTGLDSVVEYTLTETQVPSGHKAIDPIKFKIAATVSTEGDEVTAISATETADPSNAATFTVDDATVVATVVNLSGPQMPVTGAAGIAGGIVVGGALIAVSAASLRKKRASE